MAVVANRLFINISVGGQSTEIICTISVGIQNADMIVCPIVDLSGKFWCLSALWLCLLNSDEAYCYVNTVQVSPLGLVNSLPAPVIFTCCLLPTCSLVSPSCAYVGQRVWGFL